MKIFYTLTLIALVNLAFTQSENCIHLNGSTEYVQFGDILDMGTSDFTLEAWVYLEGVSTVSDKIINKGLTTVGTPSNAGYGIRTRRDAPDEIEFNVGDATGNWTSLTYNGITTNAWHHIAGVRRGIFLSIYLDGVLVAQTTCPYIYNVDTNMPFAIGAIDKGGLSTTNEYTRGKIDEVRIWNVARMGADIASEMNCKLTNQPNVVGLFNLDEVSGTVANDFSSNMNNGSLIGGNWIYSPVAQVCLASYAEMNKPDSEIELYPNPTTGFIYSNILSGEYVLMDLNGKIIDSNEFLNGQIDFSRFSSGLYFLEIKDENRVYRSKVQLN